MCVALVKQILCATAWAYEDVYVEVLAFDYF